MNWKDLKGYGRDQSKYCSSIWLERLREIWKNLSRDSWRPYQDKHQAPSECKSGALSLCQPARWLHYDFTIQRYIKDDLICYKLVEIANEWHEHGNEQNAGATKVESDEERLYRDHLQIYSA
jgi:hypothetical protein